MKQLTYGGVRVDIGGDERQLRAVLAGRLDEETRLAGLDAELAAPRVELDASGIESINSIGVREWIHLLHALRRRGARVSLVRVSEPLTSQLSMVRAARDGVEIVSVYVPYECSGCAREEAVLIDVAAHRTALLAMRPPVVPCPACRGSMELADLPERYFLFVRDAASGG